MDFQTFSVDLCLPCDLMFGAPPDKGQLVTYYAAELAEGLRDTHHFARQHLKVASDRMKAHYDQLANLVGFQEGDRVWLYRPIQKRGKFPKLQTCWEGPYTIITRINDIVYQVQRHSQAKMMVVHLDRLAPYLGATQDK